VNGPVSPRRDILRDWTRTFRPLGLMQALAGLKDIRRPAEAYAALKDIFQIQTICRLAVRYLQAGPACNSQTWPLRNTRVLDGRRF
jgi:hypothetical protein